MVFYLINGLFERFEAEACLLKRLLGSMKAEPVAMYEVKCGLIEQVIKGFGTSLLQDSSGCLMT